MVRLVKKARVAKKNIHNNCATLIFTAGGAAPGKNTAVKQIARESLLSERIVLFCENGLEQISKGDISGIRKITSDDIMDIEFRGGSILGNSRASLSTPETQKAALSALRALKESFGLRQVAVVGIGGDDTASSCRWFGEAAAKDKATKNDQFFSVAKTIDNDLPLPEKPSQRFYPWNHDLVYPAATTFGCSTAVQKIAENSAVMWVDARTSRNIFQLGIVPGRYTGWIAHGASQLLPTAVRMKEPEVGNLPPALALLPEMLEKDTSLDMLAHKLFGGLIKRIANGCNHDVFFASEGVIEYLDTESKRELSNDPEFDPHGHLRLGDFPLEYALMHRLNRLFKAHHLPHRVRKHRWEYTVRCLEPNKYDQEYTQVLGSYVVHLINQDENMRLCYVHNEMGQSIPFSSLVNSKGRIPFRPVPQEIVNEHLRDFITPRDLSNESLSQVVKVALKEFTKLFQSTVS